MSVSVSGAWCVVRDETHLQEDAAEHGEQHGRAEDAGAGDLQLQRDGAKQVEDLAAHHVRKGKVVRDDVGEPFHLLQLSYG